MADKTDQLYVRLIDLDFKRSTRRKVAMTETTTYEEPEHTYNWTCFLIPAGSMPIDDGPECQACRVQVTREVLAKIRAVEDD